jgi:hypothetical protein
MANERARKLGYKFVTDDKYLVNPFSPTEGISYEGDGSPVSYANSGIMNQAPYIYPPINQGGDGGGGGFTGPTGPGSYDSAFDPETQNKQFNEDIGVGTVAEEDDEKGTSLSIVDALRAMGAFTFGGPLNAGYSLKRSVDRNKQKEMDKMNAEIEAQYGPNDPGLRGNDGTPGFGITAKGYHTNQFDGGDPGQGGGTTSGFDTGGGKEMMARGGRVGYFFGGRVNYKAGGRINFRGGGMDMGNEANQAQSAAMGNNTSAPGPGDTGGEGGNNPRDGSDTQFGDGNNNNNNNGNERTTFFQKIKNNRIINNPLTRLVGRVGMYSVNPSLMGLDYRTASQLKGVYDKATDEVDEDDVTLNKYKQGGRVSFKNGGLASIL